MINFLILLLLPLVLLGQLLRFEPISGLSIFPHDVVIGVILLLVLCDKVQRRLFVPFLRFIKSNWLFFILWTLLACCFQIVFFQESVYLLLYILRTGFYLFFLSWFFYYLRKSDFKTIVFYSLSGVFFSIITLGMYLIFPDLRALKSLGWDDHYYRAVGTLLDPNFTGIIIVVCLLNWLGLFSIRAIRSIFFQYSLIGLLTISLGLTFSRASWLTYLFCLGLILIPVLIRLRLQFLQATIVKLILFSIALLIITITVAPKPGGAGVDLSRGATVVARQQHDQSFLDTNRVRLIIGGGLSSAPNSELKYHARLPNNLGMTILAFSGIPGLVTFFWGLSRSLKMIIKQYPLMLIPAIAVLFFAQFNAALTEPFVLLICGIQLSVLTAEKKLFKPFA